MVEANLISREWRDQCKASLTDSHCAANADIRLLLGHAEAADAAAEEQDRELQDLCAELAKAEKERDEARANYQTMLDENVSNIERAQKAEKERDELMPIAEAAKTCMKACVIAPKRDSRCPSCECLIVCDALEAAEIENNETEGEAVERLGE